MSTYKITWDSGEGWVGSSMAWISGPGVDVLKVDSDGYTDVQGVADALEKAYEAGQASVTGGTQLAQVREIFANFDWETDDRQYALEAIERIVEGEGS